MGSLWMELNANKHQERKHADVHHNSVVARPMFGWLDEMFPQENYQSLPPKLSVIR